MREIIQIIITAGGLVACFASVFFLIVIIAGAIDGDIDELFPVFIACTIGPFFIFQFSGIGVNSGRSEIDKAVIAGYVYLPTLFASKIMLSGIKSSATKLYIGIYFTSHAIIISLYIVDILNQNNPFLLVMCISAFYAVLAVTLFVRDENNKEHATRRSQYRNTFMDDCIAHQNKNEHTRTLPATIQIRPAPTHDELINDFDVPPQR